MNKYLITGFSGFVASHFVEYLYNENIECEVLGIDIKMPMFNYSKFSDRINISFAIIDLMDAETLRSKIEEYMPDYVLHLAAFSSVAYSWKHPAESFKNNSNIFLNLIEALYEINPQCRVLSVGSSEEYGNVAGCDLPLLESHPTNPVSPYAVARVSQELMSKVYVNAFGMQIILTRSFNHIGPRQDDRFVVPSFIKRISDVKNEGNLSGVIETGDVSIVRDFVDVRDVVEAYYILLHKGCPGEIYNICSGKGIKLSTIINKIADLLGVEINTIINPDYIRPNDNKEIVGSACKIKSEFGWEPQRAIEDTIRDMIIEKNGRL